MIDGDARFHLRFIRCLLTFPSTIDGDLDDVSGLSDLVLDDTSYDGFCNVYTPRGSGSDGRILEAEGVLASLRTSRDGSLNQACELIRPAFDRVISDDFDGPIHTAMQVRKSESE